MAETILVATDGSSRGEKAVSYALARAQKRGANLHAITVVDTRRNPEPVRSSTELQTMQVEEKGQKQLSAIKEVGETRGVSVETICCHGKPEDEICQYAEKIDADLIIIGYDGERRQERTRGLGGVPERVRKRESRPVTIV